MIFLEWATTDIITVHFTRDIYISSILAQITYLEAIGAFLNKKKKPVEENDRGHGM